ncbi:MAG: hypothetical protein WEC33_01470 [Dehalococcoidia bacterium]
MDDFDFGRGRAQGRMPPATPPQMIGLPMARRGTDMGTVALAIGGMTFYWMMPLLMGRAKRRRKGSAGPRTPA